MTGIRYWLAILLASQVATVGAATLTYGDADILGLGAYPSEPTAGATLEGLAPGVDTRATLIQPHGFPFDPVVGDYPGTDQIFVGSVQTGIDDGYSGHGGRLNGPQVITLDYSSLVGAGEQVETFTLGIAADDFQFPRFGQAYSAALNGVAAPALAAVLNSLDQTGPRVQFFTLGLDPLILTPGHVLTLSIDQALDGGDGWAIDFLTVGVTTTPIPVPPLAPAFGLALVLLRVRRKR